MKKHRLHGPFHCIGLQLILFAFQFRTTILALHTQCIQGISNILRFRRGRQRSCSFSIGIRLEFGDALFDGLQTLATIHGHIQIISIRIRSIISCISFLLSYRNLSIRQFVDFLGGGVVTKISAFI